MAKVAKQENDHAIVIKCDDGCRVSLVSGGPVRAYLWIGGHDGMMVDTISGEKTLRALAEAILAEMNHKPDRRRAAR